MTEMKFGVELECLGPAEQQTSEGVYDYEYQCRQSDIRRKFREAGLNAGLTYNSHLVAWLIKSDGSVHNQVEQRNGEALRHPFELNSPILKANQDGFNEVKKACSVLVNNGYITNRTCGLHVHVDVTHLTLQDVCVLAYRYANLEQRIESVIDENRHGNNNSYCHSNEASSITNFWRTIRNSETYRNRKIEEWSHYDVDAVISTYRFPRGKLNLTAIGRYKTVEFRGHHGSVDPVRVVSWVRWCLNFVKRSEVISQAMTELPEVLGTFRPLQKDNPLRGLYGTTRNHLQAMNDQQSSERRELCWYQRVVSQG